MCGKCSALGLDWTEVGLDVGDQDREFAGESSGVSTGLSTPVQNVENGGTCCPHRGAFLLKMGIVVSAAVI
jgi:hypothetical protein